MSKGQALIELIVGMGMMAIFLPALTTGLITGSSGKVQNENRQEATLLLQQAVEAVVVIRNSGWDHISVDGTYHPTISAGNWVLASGVASINQFQLWLEILPVYRLNNQIVNSGGELDPSTKQIVFHITWTEPTSSSLEITRFFTRYQDNLSQSDSTQAQFNLGVLNSVATTNTSGGEVVLSGGGHGDWCQPTLTQWGFNLNHNAQGKAISAIQGRAFIVTGDNASSEPFYDVQISDTYPPVAVSAGQLSTSKKAYGVYGDTTYAYIATDTNKQQGTVINLSNHQEEAYLNIGSASINGRSITVSGNYAYLSGTDKKIYIFDVTTKTGTKTPLTSVTLPNNAVKIIVIGTNLYAAVEGTSNQFAKIPLTGNGSAFGSPTYLSVNGLQARDLFVNSAATRAYLATAASASQPELFVIDVSTGSVLANQDTSGMDPQGVNAVTNNKVIVVGIGGYEYQVYNYNDVTHAFSTCSGGAGYLNIDSGVRGISSVVEADGDAYSYLITGDSTNEFKIIEGGPSGQTALSGTYTSTIFDAGHSTAFNRLSWTADVPADTTLQFQVAVADAVSGSCALADFLFVGPDGTSSTYFASPGAFPLNDDGTSYQNPGQCFRYRAYFSTLDTSTTPTLYDVTWGYSP